MTDSTYILTYRIYSSDDSSLVLGRQSNKTLLWEGYWGTDVYDAKDSIANIINGLKLYSMDTSLLYEQNPRVPEVWEYESNQKSIFFMNMGGTAKHSFQITEGLF